MNRVCLLAAFGALALGCDLVTTLPGHPPVLMVAEDHLSGERSATIPTSAPAASPPPKAAASAPRP